MAGDPLTDFDRMLGAESNNQHRNRDGTVKVSKAGAVGIAQVMPGTGPEAAKAAGLPWDPVRFREDPEYNKALGAGYHGALVKRFNGDERAAVAAYNSGPTRIAKLQASYGKDWEKHLVPETADYLDKVKGAVSRPVGLVDIPASNVAQGPTPGNSNPGFDPFGAAPKIQSAFDKVEEKGQVYQDALATTVDQLNQLREEKIANAQSTVKVKEAALSDIEQQTLDAKAKLTPIFARRAAIAVRKTELQDMNPIKRTLLGIFNRNYDAGHLDAVDKTLGDQAQEVGQEFAMTNQLSNTLVNLAVTRQQDKDQITDLYAADHSADLEALGQGWTVQRQIAGDSLSRLTAGESVTRAQILARNEAVTSMDDSALNTAIAEAQKGGGQTTINGAVVRLTDLTERQQQLKGQATAQEMQQLALQSQRTNVAEQAANLMLSHMSPTEVDAAIANGGTFKGVQLDQGQLTAAKQNFLNRSSLIAGESLTSIDRQTYTATIDNMNQQIQGMIGRVSGVVGAQVPPAIQNFTRGLVEKSRAFETAIHKAPLAAQPMMRAQFLTELRKDMANQDKMIDGIAQSMTKNPDAQIVLGATMKGIPMTGEQAVKGITALVTANGGQVVPGMKMTGVGGQAMKAADAAVKRVYAKYSDGGKLTPEQLASGNSGKISKDALTREINQEVSKAVSSAWVAGNMTRIQDSMIPLAQASKDPAGNIRQQDYAAAQQVGDQAGIERLGAKLGLTAEQANQVFGKGGSREAGFNDHFKDKQPPMSYAQAMQQRDLYQTQEMLRALDKSPSAREGFRPSEALVQFMNGKTFQSQVGQYSRNAPATQGFGGMVADSISGGSLSETASKFARGLGLAQAAIVAEDQSTSRELATRYRGSPMKRAGVILGAIPGLNESDEQALLNGVRSHLSQQEQGALATQIAPGSVGSQISDSIDSMILHGKFEDPKLENLRRVAAKHWVDYSKSTDTAMQRFWNGIWEN